MAEPGGPGEALVFCQFVTTDYACSANSHRAILWLHMPRTAKKHLDVFEDPENQMFSNTVVCHGTLKALEVQLRCFF